MIKFLKQKNNKSGFTLVETLVAVFILSLSIVAMMTVLASGISDTRYAKEKITATYLAQEGIEYMRNMRDNYVLFNNSFSWDIFRNELLDDCPAGSTCGIDNTKNITDPSFLYQCSISFPCELYLKDGGYNNFDGIDSGFKREITIKPINPDEIKITSKVSWMQGSIEKYVSFSENLFNWTQ